jgi:hypothetical protein
LPCNCSFFHGSLPFKSNVYYGFKVFKDYRVHRPSTLALHTGPPRKLASNPSRRHKRRCV